MDRTLSSEAVGSAIYRHTQVGFLSIVAIGIALAGLVALYATTSTSYLFPLFLIFLFLAVLFFSLTTVVDGTSFHFRFGIGLIRKVIPLKDILSCREVRNSPLHGWGIRYCGDYWLYNVSGLDAVEIIMRNGKKIRVGTDDPKGLCAALMKGIQ